MKDNNLLNLPNKNGRQNENQVLTKQQTSTDSQEIGIESGVNFKAVQASKTKKHDLFSGSTPSAGLSQNENFNSVNKANHLQI